MSGSFADRSDGREVVLRVLAETSGPACHLDIVRELTDDIRTSPYSRHTPPHLHRAVSPAGR
ncbi:hypothetical protein E2F48_14245 [Arthrobacter crusticola]|uniref:Uncharacterized protein n=1 Tax=Arthrobacter crusticola TaxID=2547960 RepID=A0A4R5TMU9_9MICC|nr:hypothetical protein E2F48_14245 [Arthrobacter crusticola]